MICHERKFIFLHLPKTGGSSVIETLFPELVGRWGTYWSHFLPKEYPAKLWRQYFTFCFLRNPWDRMVSLYHYWCDGKYLNLGRRNIPFPEFCWNYKEIIIYQGKPNIHARPQTDFLKRNSIPVKFCGRYESLQKDFDQVCDAIAIPRTRLPRLIPSVRRKRGSYRQYYLRDESLIRFVAREFAEDVRAGQYSF